MAVKASITAHQWNRENNSCPDMTSHRMPAGTSHQAGLHVSRRWRRLAGRSSSSGGDLLRHQPDQTEPEASDRSFLPHRMRMDMACSRVLRLLANLRRCKRAPSSVVVEFPTTVPVIAEPATGDGRPMQAERLVYVS